MPSKYQMINQLANDTIIEITNNSDNWMKFLKTASNNYKYRFNEQVLIYSQRPDATACAEFDVWNKKLHRWIKKGSKGIALISTQDGRNYIRHVFDVSDTYNYRNEPFALWKMKESYQNGIIDTLENNFGDLSIKENLSEAIYSATSNLVADNLTDYFNDFKTIIDKSNLQGIDEKNLDAIFMNLVVNSVTYEVMTRCNLDTSSYFTGDEFKDITLFNNAQVISRLGATIKDIADQELSEIYLAVKNYEKNIRTFVNRETSNYNKDNENNIEKQMQEVANDFNIKEIIEKQENEVERSDKNESRVQTSRRLSNTSIGDAKDKESGTGQIFEHETKLSKGTQTGTLRGTNANLQVGGTLGRNRGVSEQESSPDSQGISREEQRERGVESQRPNALGTRNEQLQESSRRDSRKRNNLQLNLFTDEFVEPVNTSIENSTEIPDENKSNTNFANSTDIQEENKLNTSPQAEVENTPAFSFTKDMFDYALKSGSGFEHGKFRIYDEFMKSLSIKETTDFLRKEYGEGGTSRIPNYEDIGMWSNSKGLTLNNGYGENAPIKTYSWIQVANEIKELIKQNKYLSEDEKIEYDNYKNDFEVSRNDTNEINQVNNANSLKIENNKNEIQIENDNLNKNFKLPDGRYFHFHSNDEGYYYSIYSNEGQEIDGGLLEYSDIDNTNQTELDIRKRIAELSGITEISNESLEEASQKFIDDLENKYNNSLTINNSENTLDNSNNIEFEDNEIEKINFKIGQVIYLESDRKYRVEAINRDLDKIELLDMTMLETAHYPITREESYLKALELYSKNERNFEDNKQEIKQNEENQEISSEKPTPLSDKLNYHITEETLGEGTPKEKVKRNIEAIKLLKKLESDNILANKDEQEILSKYVGWGGLPDVFDESKENWKEEYNELKNILTKEEYESAKASTLTAFYTPPIVINAVYQALDNFGFKKGNILEPSCGVGNFLGMLPENMKDSKLYGVELDSISGRIAKQLYQNVDIQVKGYEKTDLPDSFFDVAIGNVPFGDFRVNDKRYNKENFQIHDYFFAKTLDKVRPGGVIAFITSKGTLDKDNPVVRKYIAQRADLLGAIRLPDNTFTKNAGTKVTSDIIFLQKRDKLTDIMPDWVYLDKDENNITMNKYFIDNPQMILGQMTIESTRFGYDSTCKAIDGQDLKQNLSNAVNNIVGQIIDKTIEQGDDELEGEASENTIPAIPSVKNFSYTIVDNKLYFRENSVMKSQEELPLTNKNRIKGLIKLRDEVRTLIDLQMDENTTDEEIHIEQSKLNLLYDNFTKEYGLINSRANDTAFSKDSSYFLLCSLENLDGEGKFVGKADIFYKRTIRAKKEVTRVDTSDEALILSIQEKARVDLDYMERLTGKTKEQLVDDLKGVIFKVPNLDNLNTDDSSNLKEEYQTADEYLSGNIREKLKIAELASEKDSTYKLNVQKLKEVMPPTIQAGDIGVELGATWIPPKVIEDFIYELLDTPYYCRYNMSVNYSNINAEWYIEGKSQDRTNIKAYSTYGTNRINAYKIIEQTLNLKDVKIFDTIIEPDGTKTRVLNKKETAIASSKQDMIKEEFKNWIWKDENRRTQLVKLYNEKFNSIRPREYDGSKIEFVGMNPEIHLRKHQLNAVAHILYGNNVLLAHEVGAGKTFEMVAAAMESKRLGLCNKSLFVVPNHIIEQFASDFLELYPSANILVATKKDFETKNRKKFCSRIATGDFDAIIIGHSQFEKIPMSFERQEELLKGQIEEITNGIKEAKENRGENYTIKQLEKTKRTLETKLEKLNKQERKDDVVTFEELGVDKLFVDEAHNYKNLFLYTKMRNVGGIAQTEAQKSSDLYMKCRYLDEITHNKGTVFATGTPVSNSMAELYTMQRYLQYNSLKKNDLQHFDNWASTFGEKVTAIELSPEGTGYRAKTRFAKFHNLPELMSSFKEIADIQTADTLNLPTPEFENIYVSIKPTQIQEEMVQALGERAEKIRNGLVDAKDDNMLKITNEGRKLALDQRLMNPLLPEGETSKVKACAEYVYKIWNDYKDKKSTQLVFCDLSTPKDMEGYKKEEFTDVYNELKKKLIEKGIPEDEIKFIHEADNEVKKKELFSKVRSGEVRVLIGSTSKMGAGTNVQDKLIATHHLDCAWKPSDLTQRNGRMIRQGNENKKVFDYSYVTEKTFDAYMYQLVEQKQKFISQIMTSKTPSRTMEDIDEKALSYGEIKALATGNPKILEKTTLDTEVSKLKLLKQSFMNQKYELQDKISKYYPEEISKLDNKIEANEEDIIYLQEQTKPNEDGFSPMVINNIEYDKKEDAGKALLKAIKDLKDMEEKDIGQYRGFTMAITYDSFIKEVKIRLRHKYTYSVELGTDPYGNITRINNLLEAIEKQIPNDREKLDNTEKQLELAKQEVQKDFPQEQELQEKIKKLNEINAELKINENDHEFLGDEQEEKQDKDKNKGIPERN